MARPGISKGEVQRARLAVMRAGKHPSIDSIRIELGNTGSKATIFRFLKEIEADEGGSGLPQGSISDELQAFVTNIASRLEFESQERIHVLKAGHADEVRRLNEALTTARGEAKAFRTEAERSQVELSQEKAARQRTEADLAELRLVHRETSTQLASLQEQLKAAQGHAISLEEKHVHARESLEHFRVASKEQRDREARQHEQQLQYLQREVATATEVLTGKQGELRTALQEKVDALALLAGARAERRQVDEQLRELKSAAERLAVQTQAVDDLRAQALQASQQYETLRARSGELEQRNAELERLLAAANASAQSQEQLVREVLSRISQVSSAPATGRARGKTGTTT
ncbi:DNA-binding protein [Paucibacter sp. JuS9]|uniref:DNA-binding protein n=1 Tax=Paucibacter sp. JuS9 TaxID=3228748 RepID=UPI003757F343